jgi:hypothetical protein
MSEARPSSVCIVGAGSTGVLTGYLLSRAGAAVTFLVRPHRVEQLSRPQKLYSYDDDALTDYSGYEVMSDPADLTGSSFDLVLVTLDATALRADAGVKLVDEIGRAFRGTSTGVILACVGIDIRNWFLDRSGLAPDQVMHGQLDSFAYPVPCSIEPTHPGVSRALHDQADFAYRHNKPHGFSVDLFAPKTAQAFAALYDRNGLTVCRVVPADAYQARLGVFAILMTLELLGWPPVATIDAQDETWQLGTDAMREIQRLSVFGPVGAKASEQTSAEGLLASFRDMEKATLPMDFAAFNAYHHGGKVNGQDHELLREALRLGEDEGADMPALRAMIDRLSRA